VYVDVYGDVYVYGTAAVCGDVYVDVDGTFADVKRFDAAPSESVPIHVPST